MNRNFELFESFSNISFLVLYPGFIIYNLLVGYGFIPAFLGGYFGIISFSYLLFASVFVIVKPVLLLTKIGYYYLFFIFSLFFISSITALYSIGFNYEYYVQLAFRQYLESSILLLSTIAISFGVNINSKVLIRGVSIFVFCVFLFFSFYVIITKKSMFYMLSITEGAKDGLSTYQGYGRTFLVTGLLLLAVVKKDIIYSLLAIIIAFILFVNGSRSELIAFIFSLFLYSLYYYKSSRTLFLLLFIFLGGIFLYFSGGYEQMAGSRVFQLTNISEASSWQGRKALQSMALQQLSINPIWGIFGGHILATGTAGGYAHNVFSAWVNYGVIYFILYLILVCWPLVSTTISLFIKKENSSQLKFCFLISSSVVLLILTAKSVFWFLPGFAFGSYLRLKYNESLKNSSVKSRLGTQ